jgi:hypothetical protein
MGTGKRAASSPDVDTTCRSGTEKAQDLPKWVDTSHTSGPRRRSGRIDDRFIDQQDRNSISHRVDPPALRTLQAFSIFLEQEGFLARRANQNVEQILRKHASILRLREAGRDAPHGREGGSKARHLTPMPALVS